MEALKIVQRKAQTGYKDVDSFLKAKIVRQEPITIIILIGNNAIIDSDIRYQLEEAIGFYDIIFQRINLSSEVSIIEAVQAHHVNADVLVLARGGGENLGIFNKPAVAEVALDLDAHFLTAIGHEADKTLIQQVADKGFITPTAFGQYLNTIYNETVAELQNSKARLVEDITKQLQVNYDHKILNLKNEAAGAARQYEINIRNMQMLSEEKIKLAKESGANTTIYWILIIVAVLLGIWIGKGWH